MDSWKNFKMSEIKTEVRQYPNGYLLIKKNGSSRLLTNIETLLYLIFNVIPKDDSKTTPKEELKILRAPNENRFFIQGYTYKRDLTGWETFLFVLFNIEPKEVRESKK